MNIVAMVLAGGEGTRLYPLTAEHAEARAAVRQRLPARRLRAEQPGELAHLDDLRARAVQARVADAAHRRPPGRRGSPTARARSRCCCRAPTRWAASSRAPPTRCTSTSICSRRTRRTWWRCSPPTTSTAWTCARWWRSIASARADVTVAAVGVPLAQASHFGVAGDRAGRAGAASSARSRSAPPAMPRDPARAYASMGNYLFDPEVLERALRRSAPPRRHRFRPRRAAAPLREPRACTPTISPRTGSPACRTTRSPATGATSARSPRSPPRSRTRWAARRASTCGTAAGRSAASSTPRCSPRIRGWREAGAEPKSTPLAPRRRGKPRVEIGVATSGCSPAEVARHPGALHLTPARRLAPGRERAAHRRDQRRGLGALEEKSGLAVHDGVGQPPVARATGGVP